MDYMYTGNILIVDLESNSAEEEYLEDELIRNNLGGAAVNLELYKKYESFDPIILGTGLFTAGMVPSSALSILTAKSPLTNKISNVPITDFFGAEMKFAGFDFIVVKGKSSTPIYLWLHDEIADILSADELLGKDTWQTADKIRETQGEERIQVLSIGLAGERKVASAQIVNNYWSTYDRFSFGKVFGEKNLKAVAVRGMGELEVADPDKFLEASSALLSEVKNKIAGLKGIASIEPEYMSKLKPLEQLTHRHRACFNCPYSCRTFVKYNEPPSVMVSGQVAEPGVLLTDLEGTLDTLGLGFSAEDSARFIEKCARLGLELSSTSSIVKGSNKKTLSDAMNVITELSEGRIEASDSARKVKRREPTHNNAIAYVLGMCPIFYEKFMPSTEKLAELVSICTKLEVNAEMLKNIARRVVS